MTRIVESQYKFSPVQSPDLALPDSPYKTFAEAIDRTTPQGLVDINRLATDIYTTDEQFADARNVLGDDEHSQYLTLQAIKVHDFPPHGKIGQYTTEVFHDLYRVVHDKEDLARQLILNEIEAGTTFGLRPYELEILRTTCEVAAAYDELGLRWRDDVQEEPGNAKADELGFKNPYSIIAGDDVAGYREVAWIDRYPDTITRIAGKWRDLAERLSEMKENAEEARIFANYFTAYADALQSREPKEVVEEQWRAVDRAWMKINVETAKLHPLGTREYGYYDPNGIRVYPDMRLMLRVEALDDDIRATREALRRHLGEQFGECPLYQKTANALETVQLFPGTDVVFAGSLDFQPAGQSLPNDDIVKEELGTKVFVNADVSAAKWEISKRMARKVFTVEEDAALFDLVDNDKNGVAIRLAGHEYGEPLFQLKEIEDALGLEVVTLHNEDLADGCIGAILRRRVAEGDLPEDFPLIHAINQLGIYARLIATARGVQHLQPYYVGHALQGLRRMIASGFIARDNGKVWRIHPERIDAFYDLVEADFVTQVDIQESKDKDASAAYLAQAQETPEIRDIIKRIDPKAKFARQSKIRSS